MKSHEYMRSRSGKIKVAKVPVTAPETLAEGEFNRYYVRGYVQEQSPRASVKW